MKKITIFLFFLSPWLLAQNKMSVENYKSEFDSLYALKLSLLSFNKIMQTEIDTLNAIRERNISLIKDCEYRRLIKKYGKESGGRVASGSIWKGMTEQMLIDSWGKPDKVTTNKEKWGTFSQYYYGDVTFYFKNNKLIDWEEKDKK